MEARLGRALQLMANRDKRRYDLAEITAPIYAKRMAVKILGAR